MKRSNEDARSSQLFFSARVKNKREFTKLSHQLKALEREFGHTIYDIHKEIRDLKSELKVTRRSSGRISEGWFPEMDDASGNPSTAQRSRSSSGFRVRRQGARVVSDGKRVTSAPVGNVTRHPKLEHRVTKNAEHSNQVESSGDHELSEKEAHDIGSTVESTIKHGIRPPATSLVHLSESVTERSNYENVDHAGSELSTLTGGKGGSCVNPKTKMGTVIPSRKNSWLKPISKSLTATTELSSETKEGETCHNSDVAKSARTSLLPENWEERPLSPKMVLNVKNKWLKPALKMPNSNVDDGNKRPKKTVRIAGQSSENTNTPTTHNGSEIDEKKQVIPTAVKEKMLPNASEPNAVFLTEPDRGTSSSDRKAADTLGMLFGKTVPKKDSDDLRPKSPNVIPDVRKKTISQEEIQMKKKRDRLLACSVSALLGGNPLRNPKSDGSSENEKGAPKKTLDESNASAEDVDGRAPSPLRRRFSFGSITLLAMSQHKTMSVEKKSTLGNRLKIKTPAEEREGRKIDIKKSVQVNDSDSDDDRKDLTAPPKPAIDLKNVKSKISNQWKQDIALDKPPTLEDDTFQLQRSLKAAHISRDRDLRLMQDDNEVDPVKTIDENRKTALMLKLKSFNDVISVGKRQDTRRKSIIDAIHAGTEGKDILKLIRMSDKP